MEATLYSDSESTFIIGSTVKMKTPLHVLEGRRSHNRQPEPTRILASDEETYYDEGKIAYWGNNNDYPQLIRKKGEANTILGPGIDFKARLLFAGGIDYGVMSMNEDGEKEFMPVYNEEIEEWKRINRLDDYYVPAAALNFYWYMILFPELVLSRDRKRINQIKMHHTDFVRWARQKKNGHIKGCYLSGNWEYNGFSSHRNDYDIKYVPALSPYTRPQDVRNGRKYKYIYPSYYPSPGRVYYPRPIWTAALESGWYDLAQKIPSSKNAQMDNKIAPQFLVYAHEKYWKKKFPEWEDLSKAEKKEKMEAVRQEIEDTLTSPENHAKTIFSSMTAPHPNEPGKSIKLLEIEPIADPRKDGADLEDSREATTHLMNAIGVSGTLMGNVPGTDSAQNAGSGANTREATNMHLMLTQAHASITLALPNFVAWYNGWKAFGKQIVWRYRKIESKVQNELAPEDRGI